MVPPTGCKPVGLPVIRVGVRFDSDFSPPYWGVAKCRPTYLRTAEGAIPFYRQYINIKLLNKSN